MSNLKFPEWASDKIKEGMSAFVGIVETYPSLDMDISFQQLTFDDEIGFDAEVSWLEFGIKIKKSVLFHVVWNYEQLFTPFDERFDCWQFVFDDVGREISVELFFVELFFSVKKMLIKESQANIQNQDDKISAFGDGYYDGFNDAKKINDGDTDDCGYLSDHSEDDIRNLSEKAESEYSDKLTERQIAKESGIALIAKERSRQISEEGYTSTHDDKSAKGSLAMAAIVYATTAVSSGYMRDNFREKVSKNEPIQHFPWQSKHLKVGDNSYASRIKELTKSGALIAAEIDKLQRISAHSE